MRKKYWPAVIAVLAALAFPHSASADLKAVSGGAFVDAQGSRHNWRISETGTLYWEAKPYLPVGSAVTSSYLTSQTEETWQADVKTLEALKSKAITDVLIRASGPATASPPAAWQKLLDYLDSQGFTYGIDLSDGPGKKAAGFIVSPGTYKLPKVTQTGAMQLTIPHTSGGFFVTAEESSGSVLDSGVLRVSGDKFTIDIHPSETKSQALILFPVKEISTARGALPDLWQGYDGYRDRLIDFFGHLKFGSGLRFFLDPLDGGMAPAGEAESAIPDSASFRMEFEGWLSLKYSAPDDMNAAWSLTKRDAISYEQAARLIPLWWKARGLSLAYDRASDRYIEVDVPKSRMWQDILEFRDLSLQEYMNGAADTLKRFAADVPVLYTSDSYNRVFVNGAGSGFDGLLSISSGASDQGAVAPGRIFALAADAAKTLWLVGAADAQASELSAALSRPKDLGAKGFFALPSGDSTSASAVADALAGFKSALGADAADFTPEALFYPVDDSPGAGIRKLDQNTWWLPTMRRGEAFQFGENVFGYRLPGAARNHADVISLAGGAGPLPDNASGGVVLWSNVGPLTASILLQGQTLGISATNKAAVLSAKKGVVALRLSDSPIALYGLPASQLFPLEVAQDGIEMLARSVTALAKSGGSATGYSTVVANARGLLQEGLIGAAYDMAASNMRMLASTASSYVWLEGENPQESSFTGVESFFNCSGGRYLKLSTKDDAPLGPYAASYPFNAASDGTYEVWLAATPPGELGNSDLRYSLDASAWQQIQPAQQTPAYADGMAWFKAGSVSLTRGSHSLTIQALRSKPDVPYNAAIDVILLTKKPFIPAGAKKPVPVQ